VTMRDCLGTRLYRRVVGLPIVDDIRQEAKEATMQAHDTMNRAERALSRNRILLESIDDVQEQLDRRARRRVRRIPG
jgi:5-methylthioribose kinase